MEKKVSEKEKMYQRATKMVEKLVAEGLTLTNARNRACEKFGIGQRIIVKRTMHLSPRANKELAAAN